MVPSALMSSIPLPLPGKWFKFYAISTFLFLLAGASIAGLLYLSTLEPNGRTAAGAIAALFGVLTCATIYFRLLGRLAFVFTQQIEVEVDLPEDLSGLNPDDNTPDETEISLGV